MELTNKQRQGLIITLKRYADGEKYTCISGYAGSGKSTLVKYIIEALGIDTERVAYVAYTGKAANVLRQKGCPNAVTAHQLLYYAKQGKDGKYYFTPKSDIGDYRIVVVDEISMLPLEMWNNLIQHPVYIIACGDPGQLPPIDPSANNHILDKPHIFLDEIMRQAQDSEIIRLSMHIREGKPLSTYKGNNSEVKILKPNELVDGVYDWADQVLCATNGTRNNINNFVRQKLGYPKEPQIRDKIIGLTNHWDCYSNNMIPLTNGAIGKITGMELRQLSYPLLRKEPIKILSTSMLTEDDEMYNTLPIDYDCLITGNKTLTGEQEYNFKKVCKGLEPPYDFAFGYAITVWKAQGGEWSKVLLYEEGHPFNKEEHIKYLYTGITRAANKLVLVTR